MKNLFLLFSVLFPALLSAQSFTAVPNTSMTTQSNGYYEYLPAGYNSGNLKYPVLIFFHGSGERGDGSPSQLPRVLAHGTPQQISQGIFPSSFTVNGKTFSFIVIAPQLMDDPQASGVNDIVNYVINHYRVDTTRIYLTGLSMGGGVTWEYPGEKLSYAQRIAAIVPVCGNEWPANDRIQNIAAANLPVWATHNNGDPTVPVSYTIDFVNGINSQNPPPNPKAKMTIFNSNSHDAWTATYDLNFKEDGMNIYEWMLQYKRTLSALAVEDLQFDVRLLNNTVALTWSAAKEINNQGFIVEKSSDGSHFDSLAYVPSASSGNHIYQYTDNHPSLGINYYRLKMTEITGAITYSTVLHVAVENSTSFILYPNPVNNNLHIRTTVAVDNGQLRVMDMSGKTLLQQSFSGVGDHNFNLSFSAGIYIATIMENGKMVFKQTFTKQ